MEANKYLNWGKYTWIAPVALLGIYLIWLFMPLPILKRGSRYWFIKVVFRAMCGK
jgi:hypothetical protein